MTRGPARGLDPTDRLAAALLPLALNADRVRLYRSGCAGGPGWLRRAVLALSGGRAVALGNRVFLPDRCERDSAVLAHELTHCAQYQAWGPLRYYLRGAAVQLRHLVHRGLGLGRNPYVWEDDERPFESFGMEQQGQIVEDATRGHPAARRVVTATPFRRPG
ncbi:MAG TPA: DUF4157 domain-containing protein [Gemmatimonadales bacterium]|nr:DUF4157 domain-containing protein [Gemmatimonadales bacterium]